MGHNYIVRSNNFPDLGYSGIAMGYLWALASYLVSRDYEELLGTIMRRLDDPRKFRDKFQYNTFTLSDIARLHQELVPRSNLQVVHSMEFVESGRGDDNVMATSVTRSVTLGEDAVPENFAGKTMERVLETHSRWISEVCNAHLDYKQLVSPRGERYTMRSLYETIYEMLNETIIDEVSGRRFLVKGSFDFMISVNSEYLQMVVMADTWRVDGRKEYRGRIDTNGRMVKDER